jgi:site-specific DNA recombinase
MSNPFPPNSQVAAYLRDSGGDEQEQSIGGQERAIRDWCVANGLSLTRIFQDTRSATSTIGRVGFQNMMDYFTSKTRPPEAGVILWTYSRFSREINDSQYYKAELRRRGFIIHSLNDAVPDGLEGRLIESILEWKDASFSRDLSIHVKRGLSDMVRNAGGVPGVPPRGFKREPIEIGKHRSGEARIVHRWVPDPETWLPCKRAWEMRAGGCTYREIMREVNIYKSANCYRTFFANPIYKGELHYGDMVIDNYCEPMVDAATWEYVQSLVLVDPNGEPRNHPRRKGSPFLLSGLAFCGLCGSPLSGRGTSCSTRSYSQRYYFCIGKNGCGARNVPKELLEEEVIKVALDAILTPENIMESYAPPDNAEIEDELKRLRVELGNVKKSTNKLISLAEASGDISAISERLKELEKERVRVSHRIQELERAEHETPTVEELETSVRNYIARIKKENPAELKSTLAEFIQRIDVIRDADTLRGTIYYCLNAQCPQGGKSRLYNFEDGVKYRYRPSLPVS